MVEADETLQVNDVGKAETAFERVPAADPGEVLVGVGNLLREAVAGGVGPVEGGDAGNHDHRPGAGQGAGEVRILPIGPRKAKLVQQVLRDGADPLHADHVGAVAEIAPGVQGAEAGADPATTGVYWELVAEVVVAQEDLVAGGEVPVHARIEKLPVQDPWAAASCYVAGNAQSTRICRQDGDGRRHAPGQVLIGTEDEQLILDDGSTGIRGKVLELQLGLFGGG